MRQWFIGTNNYWFTSTVFLEETPFVLIIMDYIIAYVCYMLSLLHLTKIAELWHIYVCTWIVDLKCRYTKTICIPMPYFYLKEKIPKEFESDYEYSEEIVTNNRNIARNYSNRYKEYSREFKERISKLIKRSTYDI
jgi:hypothetical protein